MRPSRLRWRSASFAPDLVLPKGGREVNGQTEMIKAVREQIGHGADWVQAYADYRELLHRSVPGLTAG